MDLINFSNYLNTFKTFYNRDVNIDEAYKIFVCIKNDQYVQKLSSSRDNNNNNNKISFNDTNNNVNVINRTFSTVGYFQQQKQSNSIMWQRPRRYSKSPDDRQGAFITKRPRYDAGDVKPIENRKCFICRERGHIAVDCAQNRNNRVNRARRDFTDRPPVKKENRTDEVDNIPKKSPSTTQISIKNEQEEFKTQPAVQSSKPVDSTQIEELESFVLKTSETELKSKEDELKTCKHRLKCVLDNKKYRDEKTIKLLEDRVKVIEGEIELLKSKCEQYRVTIGMFKRQLSVEGVQVGESKKKIRSGERTSLEVEKRNPSSLEINSEEVKEKEEKEKVKDDPKESLEISSNKKADEPQPQAIEDESNVINIKEKKEKEKVKDDPKEEEKPKDDSKESLEINSNKKADEPKPQPQVIEDESNVINIKASSPEPTPSEKKRNEIEITALQASLSISLLKKINGVNLNWDLIAGDDGKLAREFDNYESLLSKIKEYHIYGCLSNDTNDSEENNSWTLIATIESCELPETCTLSDFVEGCTYKIAIKIKFNDNSYSSFSKPQIVKF